MADSSGFDYEVFLSFRGLDTRAGFTDFLYNSLINAGIHAYRDDEELHIGEEIGPELLQAIKQSRISIPIFSKRYASSKWCLKELVQMVECKKSMGQKIMPIFYDVEPSEIRDQTGRYGQAFIEHKSRGRYGDGTISEWKAALSEVGAIKGWDLNSMPNRREGDLVKTVVKEVFSELKKGYLVLSDCLVEVDNHVSEIMRMIDPQTHETRIVGIRGMGGAGKTTLAKIIYNKLLPDFEHRCFLSNIRETSKVKGVEYLQNQLISDVLKRKGKDISISNTDEGIETIKDRLCGKRLLLVLDDVDRKNQLNALMGKRDWFGEGSKVIITSRNKEVLNLPEVDWTYELNCMDFDKSLRLFSKHAFRRDRPLDDYLAHSRKAVSIAGGLPLALEVIGSLLSCNSKEKWDDILKKLEIIPHEEVSSKLKISYEALDDRQKHIFLDIACFFIGCDKEVAIHMWDETEFFPEEALEVLQHMSLIKIVEKNTLWMHDLLRDLGREIIRQDSNMVTEKQTRVWDADEASDLLMTKQEKERVEALCLQFSRATEHHLADKHFMRLPNLRFLAVDGRNEENGQRKDPEPVFGLVMRNLRQNFHLPINFFRKKSHQFPKLRWLSWYSYPLNFDIGKLSMQNLVVLDLARSAITHHWDGWSHIKMAKTLKVLNLSGCEELVKTPDFSGLANLERLIMLDCVRLVKVHKSIGQLQRLVFLDVRHCWELDDLPNEIQERKSLKVLRSYGRRMVVLAL
ncbi:disease resistance protein RPV1-like [Syzygium oleosum]|uniref:disease resistance protein RPV1-like n=1 Tax=Syzygium oleosum TaxID=219896 RepID=UPI0024BB26CE|nr:disease resistance protein RPV1-like [Syzygium oleosum]